MEGLPVGREPTLRARPHGTEVREERPPPLEEDTRFKPLRMPREQRAPEEARRREREAEGTPRRSGNAGHPFRQRRIVPFATAAR